MVDQVKLSLQGLNLLLLSLELGGCLLHLHLVFRLILFVALQFLLVVVDLLVHLLELLGCLNHIGVLRL